MFAQQKPFTAVSQMIDRMTNEQFEEEDLSGIIDLIEIIRIQASGPTEAARAIRKKLKYGSQHRQLRALVILDGLIQNAGSRFQKTFADEALLERLRWMVRDETVDAVVRQKCNILFRQWAVAYKDTPGLGAITSLHKELPQPKKRQPVQTKSVRETEAEAAADPADIVTSPQSARGHSRNVSAASASGSSPSATRSRVTIDPTPKVSSHKSSKKSKHAIKFNMSVERPKITQTIAQASIASNNLTNALKLINREVQRVSENSEAVNRFETCKALRRQVLAYIQLVEGDEIIGSLLNANDELVKALTAYDLMDRDAQDDSDSEWENPAGFAQAERGLKGMKLGGDGSAAPPPKPARPAAPAPAESESESEESAVEEDPNDPFGDSNAVKTPGVERAGMTWKTV